MLPMCFSQLRLSMMVTTRYLLASKTSSVWPWNVYNVSKIFWKRVMNLMTIHFVGLKLICHVSSHFSSTVRSSRRSCLSLSFSITLKTSLSSANSFDDDDLMTSGRLLMKAKNNSRLSPFPCETTDNYMISIFQIMSSSGYAVI